MKKAFLLAVIFPLCFACQKTEVQSSPGMSAQNAVEGHLVGIGFYGGSHPLGDATVSNGQITGSTTVVQPGGSATVTAVTDDRYTVDFWWQYGQQPSYDASQPIPPRTKVHYGQMSFTQKITGETWFEPVFKLRDPVSVFINFDIDPGIRGELRFSYTDINGETHNTTSTEILQGSSILELMPGTELRMHGDFKNDADPTRYYAYGVWFNGDFAEPNMPYHAIGDIYVEEIRLYVTESGSLTFFCKKEQ